MSDLPATARVKALSEAATPGPLSVGLPDRNGQRDPADTTVFPANYTPWSGDPNWQSLDTFVGLGRNYVAQTTSDTRNAQSAEKARADAQLLAVSVNIIRLMLSDEGVERMARAIDPSIWSVFDGHLREVQRKYKGENAGYDPDAFKDKKSMALVRAALNAIFEQVLK